MPWQVRVRNVGIDVVLHNRIDEVAAGTGAALTGSRQVIERDVVSGVGIDELFARSNAIAGSVILAANFAEVAGPFGGAQNREDGRSLALAAAPALIGGKEKELVFLDGTADRAAKDVALERLFGQTVRKKVVSGVQVGVAQKLEPVSVESIGSRFRNLIDDSSGSPAVFCVVIVGENLEFFDGVWIGIYDNIVAEKIGVVGAVQQKGQGLGTLAADGERIPRAVIWIRIKNASLEQAELKGVAVSQRKIVDHALILNFSEDSAGRIHLDDVGSDLDRLIFLADFQRDVEAAVLIQLEDDAVLEKG